MNDTTIAGATVDDQIDELAQIVARRLERILEIVDRREPPDEIRSWRDHAACFGTFDGRFFSPDPDDRRAAASAYCATCLVRVQCGRWASDTGQHTGVWGGRDLARGQRIEVASLAERGGGK